MPGSRFSRAQYVDGSAHCPIRILMKLASSCYRFLVRIHISVPMKRLFSSHRFLVAIALIGAIIVPVGDLMAQRPPWSGDLGKCAKSNIPLRLSFAAGITQSSMTGAYHATNAGDNFRPVTNSESRTGVLVRVMLDWQVLS
jgi:hypothetical protein